MSNGKINEPLKELSKGSLVQFRIVRSKYGELTHTETTHLERGATAKEAIQNYIAYTGREQPVCFHMFKTPLRTKKCIGYYDKEGIVYAIKEY